MFIRLLPERYHTRLPRGLEPDEWLHQVAEPGPHLRLICLAVENSDDVTGNLDPCVKYGLGIWLSSLNSIPKPFQNSLLGLLKFCYCGKNSSLLPPLREGKTSVFLNSPCCSKMTDNLCEVTNGCHALWRPMKIKPSAKWNQRAVEQ